MSNPGITAIVCGFNSAEVIGPAIRALAAQEVPAQAGYEVILVDNNCSDDTVQLAKEAWENEKCIRPLLITEEREPGLIHARKKGISRAHYDILLFVDDDNILSPDWIVKLADLYEKNPDVGAVGGRNEPLFEGSGPPWFDDFASMYACTPSRENPGVSAYKKTLFGAGLSLRTRLAREIFGSPLPMFLVGRKENRLLRGEDSEICLRAALMGWKLWYECSLRLEHFILKTRLNWEYVLTARRHGGQADIILNIYREMLDGGVPPDYDELAIHIGSLWKNYWDNRIKGRNLADLKKEGSRTALRYHYLQGLTEGFLNMEKHEYQSIRRQIVSEFSVRKNP